ncbi:MAG: hypothetical protein ACRDJU_06485 [Actinomycetota bacterium]
MTMAFKAVLAQVGDDCGEGCLAEDGPLEDPCTSTRRSHPAVTVELGMDPGAGVVGRAGADDVS